MSDTEKTREQWYDECIQMQQNGNLAGAVTELAKLAEVYPDYPLVHLALAVFYNKQNRDTESLAQMSLACDLAKEDPFYYTAFSALAIKSGQRTQAEEALMKAQEARFAAQLAKMREENQAKNEE